jgi:hypothetical protein
MKGSGLKFKPGKRLEMELGVVVASSVTKPKYLPTLASAVDVQSPNIRIRLYLYVISPTPYY